MERQIWKFPLKITDEQQIEVPFEFEILCIQTQNDIPCLWCLVYPNNTKEKITILTYGTGHEIDDDINVEYIGTYQKTPYLVFHCFLKS